MTYNVCNYELKQERMIPDGNGGYKRLYANRIAIRNHFKQRCRSRMPAWAREGIPDKVMVGACSDLATAWSNAYKVVGRGEIEHGFDIKYRSVKQSKSETIHVEKSETTNGTHNSSPFLKVAPKPYANCDRRAECLLFLGCGFRGLGGIRLQDKKSVIDRLLAEGSKLKEDGKIVWCKRMRAFYFVHAFEIPKLAEPDPDWTSKRVIALDGGIRGFQTFASTNGEYGELVCGFRDRIHDRVEMIDNLHSRFDRKCQGKGLRTQDKRVKTRAQRRHDRENAIKRRIRQGQCPRRKPSRRDRKVTRAHRQLKRQRVRKCNWVEAVHYDAANFLLKRTEVVINPVLRTSQMAPRAGRVFGAASTSAMLTMSHYAFNKRLQSAAVRYAGRRVIDDTGEPGTSRTCPNPECGRWHANLGGDHVFVCPRCGVSAKRDDVGARGNLLAAYGQAVGVLADGTSNA